MDKQLEDKIIKPINTNIFFSDIQIGGTALEILEKIKDKNYQWLKTDNNIYFQLNDIDKNKNKIENLNYLNKGKYTVVFSIKLLKDQDTNKNWNDKYNNKLILRVTTENSSNIIKSYINDKPFFKENLIDIYLYGEIKNSETTIGYYTLTREYETDFNKLNIINKIKIIRDYFTVIIKASENNIFYRDQKYANCGYDIINDEYKFIILDYDDITLVDIENWFSENDRKTHRFYGTYPPNYMIQHIIMSRKSELDNIRNYNKLYVGGMIDILNSLFKFNNLVSEYLQYIYNSLKNNSLTMKQTDDLIIKINKLYPYDAPKNKKYIDIKNIKENKENNIRILFNYLLKNIIIKCVNYDYSKVLSIDEMKHIIIDIDEIFLNLLCKIDEVDISAIKSNVMLNKYFIIKNVGGYYSKYLKYKQKYLELKKNIFIE